MDIFSESTRRVFNIKNLISLQLDSSSKGNQQKWYDKEGDLYIKSQFCYQGKYWNDDLVERISYILGTQLSYSNQVSILEQDLCTIKDGDTTLSGVYSKNFCKTCERFVSFKRILDIKCLHFPSHDSIKVKWNFVLDLLNRITGSDCTEYLIIMSLLDFLIGNEDRHLNNFGLLTDGEYYRLSPIFDSGLGLFEHDMKYLETPFRECLSMMECKPFSANNMDTIKFLQSNYDLDKYLPDIFDLSNVILPSPKAGSYILNQAHYLKRDVKGI